MVLRRAPRASAARSRPAPGGRGVWQQDRFVISFCTDPIVTPDQFEYSAPHGLAFITCLPPCTGSIPSAQRRGADSRSGEEGRAEPSQGGPAIKLITVLSISVSRARRALACRVPAARSSKVQGRASLCTLGLSARATRALWGMPPSRHRNHRR